MTADTEARLQAVEIARGLVGKLAVQCEARGLSRGETLLGTLRGTMDTAARIMNPIAAVEMLRTYLDMIERELMQEPHQ